jgi:O-antigen/teichoic acid export membrane protein
MSTRRAVLFSFIDRYSALVLSIASSMAIARLLTPADIGVFSVTMVFIMFISSMRDLGAGQYLVQEKTLTPERIRATWTVLLCTGLLMAVVVLAAAYPVSYFFKEPRMVDIMLVISLNFALNPLGSMTYAWLMREMRFDALASMRFASSVAGAATSVACAYYGQGPISLAYGNLAATLVNALVSLRYRPEQFGWKLGTAEIPRVVGFGGKIWATSVTMNIATGAPEFLLGRLQNLTASGLYSRGNGLASMFQKLVLDATQAVALPLFARSQREAGRIDEPMVRALCYVTAVGWPFFIGLALLGYPLTRLLYGNQWDESVGVMRYLALGMAIGLPASLCPHALMASGRGVQILKTSLTVMPMQVLCVAVGAYFSLEAAGIGFLCSQLIAVPIWLGVCWQTLGLRPSLLWQALKGSAVLAALTSLAPLSCVALLGLAPASNAGPLAYSAALGVLVFLLGARWLKHPIQEELSWVYARIRWPRR